MKSPTYNLYKLNRSSNFGRSIDSFRFIIRVRKIQCYMKINGHKPTRCRGVKSETNRSVAWTA